MASKTLKRTMFLSCLALAGGCGEDAPADEPGGEDAALAPADASALDAGDADATAPPDAARDGQADTAAPDAARDDATSAADTGSEPCAELSYANFAQPFFASFCTRCHSGPLARAAVQLDSLANVRMHLSAIEQEAVLATRMPPNAPFPSASQRAQLGAWIACGAD